MTEPKEQPKTIDNVMPAEEAPNLIPPQYKGMPSEIVEDLWQSPVYIDEIKNQAETERKEMAINEIKQTEQNREVQKQKELERQYANLSDEQKTDFLEAQKGAARILGEYIQGKAEIENLMPEEAFVLDKLRVDYTEFKKENPDKPFAFDLAKDIDRAVYNNLAQRLAFEGLGEKQIVVDQEKANASREKLGLLVQEKLKDSIQETIQDNLVSPKQEGQENYEDIDKKDYEEFRVKNGETDIGVFWYEYGNAAAKRLKESGNFEWGKERIYFDIPLDDMEELRDLAFKVARDEKIPIAFKHLDVKKTHQVDLQPDSETTHFVANFASIVDAKRFYNTLQQNEQYRKMKSDRNMDYHGYNLDGVAHYASGYREKREPLKRIIETAQKNQDNTYSYYSADGSKKIILTEDEYNNFKEQYEAIPDPEEAWKGANY